MPQPLPGGGEGYICEYRVRHRDGRWLSVIDRSMIRRDREGRIVRRVGCTQDITDRKRTEEALRESESLFRQMAEAVPSIIWTADPDGTITYANLRWYRYCGLTPEE